MLWCLVNYEYSRTPHIRIKWDGELSEYTENADNWIFLWKWLHWHIELRLFLFTVCTCVETFLPLLIWSARSHITVLFLIRQPVISKQVIFVDFSTILWEEPSQSRQTAIRITNFRISGILLYFFSHVPHLTYMSQLSSVHISVCVFSDVHERSVWLCWETSMNNRISISVLKRKGDTSLSRGGRICALT